jgi:hypothetical protein
MPVPEFGLMVSAAVKQYQRVSGQSVGRDAQALLLRHAAPQIDEIDRRLKAGELSRDELVSGIVKLLRDAGISRRSGFQKRDLGDGRLGFGVPMRGLSIHEGDVERAMAKNCPVFPYCPEAGQCPH